MKGKKKFGIGLIFLGVILSFMNINITGRIIGTFGMGGFLSLLSLLSFIIGISLTSTGEKSRLEEIVDIPKKKEIKAIRKMEQGVKSGKKYSPHETESLLKKAGYDLKEIKGDHLQVIREGEGVRNPPTDKRPNSIVEFDKNSKSYNPEGVIKAVLYDFRERQFKDHYSQRNL